jgi:deazaflavin-dependent oxidoreductase (nitroreductase family)
MSDYEPSATDWVREQVERIVESGTTEGVTVKDRPVVLLTYTGRRTGKTRKTPVMRVEHDGSYAAVASQGGRPKHPHWYQSILAQPVVELQDGSRAGRYRAREVTGEEKARWWRRAAEAFPDYDDYQGKTDRQIPVLVLEPAE